MKVLSAITLAALAAVGINATSVERRASGSVPVTIQVYRHGNSCQNVATQCQKKGNTDPICKDYDYNIRDSTLSNWGVTQTSDLSTGIPKTDVVMSSVLLRAVETGLYMWPKKTVYPVPYVKEVDFKPPNVALSVPEQRLAIAALDGADYAVRVNYTYEADPTYTCQQIDQTPRCQADWDNFLTWLGYTLATAPPKEVAGKIKAGKPITISVVTHSIMITSEILRRSQYVSNNQGFESNFTFNPTTQTVTHDDNAPWTDIIVGSKSPCNGRSIASEDTARCAARNPSNWANFQTACLV